MLEIKKTYDTFYIGDKDSPTAEINFGGDGNKIFIHHTVVAQELQGKGIASQLVAKVVELARKENKKVIPICSYAVREFEKRPEYSDVWAKQ